MKSIFEWKEAASRLEERRSERKMKAFLHSGPISSPNSFTTTDQTLVKAFGNTGSIMQGWEMPPGTITTLKTQESIQQETKQTESCGTPREHDCWVEKQLLKNSFLDLSQRTRQAGEAAYSH